jgi:hypothetical protein
MERMQREADLGSSGGKLAMHNKKPKAKGKAEEDPDDAAFKQKQREGKHLCQTHLPPRND